MNQKQTFHGDIDQLLKTSKQLQNKLRQELSQEVGFSSETFSPVWDDVPYFERVVASFKKSMKPYKPPYQEATEKSGVQVIESQNLESKKVVEACHKKSATVGTQVTQNQLQKHSLKKEKVNMKSSATSLNKTKKPLAKSGSLEAKKNQSDWYTPRIKSTTNLQCLPMQRFVGTSKEKIDFAEVHPNLELDSSSNRSTLFPRRMPKGGKTSDPLLLSPDSNTLNVAAASIKRPKAVPAHQQQETWKDLLQNNRSSRTTKDIEIKNNENVVDSHKESKVEDAKDIEIILKPPNGLFHLEKQTGRLSKQKKCNFQHFPVMYIRPECQVQRVANISIGGICTEMENCSTNVKYVECMHQEKEKPIEECSSLSRAEVDIVTDKDNHIVTKGDNRYFKALELNENLKKLSIGKESTVPLPKSPGNLRSIYSHSSSKSLDLVESSDKKEVIEGKLSTTDRPHSISKQNVIKNPPTRREVYVQTDNKETLAPTHLSPAPPVNLTTSVSSREHDTSVEDEFITKIFKRIHNDVPSVTQSFKNRNTNAHQPVPTTTNQHQKHNQSHQHQMSAISKASNVDLLPNETEQGFQERFQAKRHNDSQNILQMPNPIDSSASLTSLSAGSQDRDFLLLQQNLLFEQTINRIKPSAITSDGRRIKEDRQKYPTDAEIKSAVKIFLDSLALDSGGGGVGNAKKKSIMKCDGVRKYPSPLRSKLISSKKVNDFVSWDSSSSSCNSTSSKRNVRKTRNVPRSDVSGSSSTSTTISYSNSEQETDVTEDSRNHKKVTSLSEGEVLSIGEI